VHPKILDRIANNSVEWSKTGEMNKRLVLMGVTSPKNMFDVMKEVSKKIETQHKEKTNSGPVQ
jgi:hypothetical protein